MEKINAWTKRLFLGPDEVSSRTHSTNLTLVYRSNNFEIDEFTKQRVEQNVSDEPTRNDYSSSSTKTTEPLNAIERCRMHEWSVMVFNDEFFRCVPEKDGFACIKNLTTPLQKPNVNVNTIDKIDNLGDSVDEIFYSQDFNETSIPDPIDDENVEDNSESMN